MPLYFFHIRSADDFVRDDEGIDLPDLASAKWEAHEGAKGLLKEAIDMDKMLDGQKFEVTDSAGNLLFDYPFRDAIKLPA